MPHVSNLISQDSDAYLGSHETKSLLRFITCGSVRVVAETERRFGPVTVLMKQCR
jgi:hypothetical protein